MAETIEEKIGQLFFVGISGSELNSDNRNLLEKILPGGICFFSRNIKSPEQTVSFIQNIKEILPDKPLFSIDQEGGLVDRLRRILTPMPAAGAIKSSEQAKQLAALTSKALRLLGFNMNFAPVVDVIDEDRTVKSNGLYSRAFGGSEKDVVQLAGIYLETLQKNGCLGCLKHFPGLGDSQTDSHEELPIVNLTSSALSAIDLVPYRELFIENQVHAVMVAHAAYPLLDLQETDADGKLLPSSLSYNIINNLLRREMKFDGLIISDDLEMGAILKNYSIGEACVMAINAGVDMVSICADPSRIQEGFETVVAAVKTGRIAASRIEESLERVLHFKSLTVPSIPFEKDRWQTLSQEIAEFNKKLKDSFGG